MGVQTWPSVHPRPWISDPADNHRYEAHHYFGRDGSSRYVHRYADEAADAAARGW